MTKTLSSIISYILNPLIFPTLGLLVLLYNFHFGFKPEAEKILLLLVFSGTFFLPVLIFPILKYYKLIDKFDITNKKDRLLPLTIVFISYFITYMVLKNLGMPFIIRICILSPIISLVISFAVTIFWKISIHMLGIGGFTGMFVALLSYINPANKLLLMVIIIVAAGLLGTARLILKMHSQKQIYIGYFTGFIIVFLLFSIFIQQLA